MKMRVTVTFHPMDEFASEARSRVSGGILTIDESRTEKWTLDAHDHARSLTYVTELSATEVVEAWEGEGFEIAEFDEFKFTAIR